MLKKIERPVASNASLFGYNFFVIPVERSHQINMSILPLKRRVIQTIFHH